MRVNPARCTWTTRDKFLIPANCTMWAVYSFFDATDRDQARLDEIE